MKQIEINGKTLNFEIVESKQAKNIRFEFRFAKSLLRLICPQGKLITNPEEYLKKANSWIIKRLEKLDNFKTVKAKDHSFETINEFKENILVLIKKYLEQTDLRVNKVFFKNFKSRMGSCSIRKNININLKLIDCPSFVQEYVVVHEVAHLKYMNHSKDFKQFVKTHYPHTRKALNWLKTHHLK